MPSVAQSVVQRPAALALPRSLLEMHRSTSDPLNQNLHLNKSPVMFAHKNVRSVDLEQGSASYGQWAKSGLFL